MIRGFLARKNYGFKETTILYNRIASYNNLKVQFMLIKYSFLDYKLVAEIKFTRPLVRMARVLESLPFDEEETLEMFEECLRFKYEDGEIEELDLKAGAPKRIVMDAPAPV
jgi:hypothetical protein